MRSCFRIACSFVFLFFLSPQNSTFTSLSQASFYPLSSQKCSDVEKAALLQLKRDLSAAIPESTVAGDSLLPSWKPNTDCCSWEGVSCHEVTAHVIGLNISGYNFYDLVDSGDILELPYLERLNLVNCSIGGIPSFLRNMSGLIKLDLSSNKIGGQVPKWIWQLESLVHLNLASNFFNGIEVPVPSPKFSSLTFLDLTSNLLEGSIPVLPPSIKFLSLAINRLTGEIPASFCNMSRAVIGLRNRRCNEWIEQSFKAKKGLKKWKDELYTAKVSLLLYTIVHFLACIAQLLHGPLS
ncbi:unnamed protein product [Dovyalis caffra]|uniref:Leucine-rich repeat-containing N-terminal plant-type domain-containing protein n=1 Tax=Dovyalis caffra TaxID=77055 RepID=A0AAV1QTF4_9ROSI|nr:unnamed protein product [Dovyalis caffra]